jgi:putative PIN family toxin of toxin-antitoxin system
VLRVVLDSNVLISAAIRPSGPPGQIIALMLAESAFELVLSPAIIREVEAALRLPKIRRYLLEPGRSHKWLDDIAALADVVVDTGKIEGVCRDPADEIILAAAIEGRADVIVSGDSDLLDLQEHAGIAIVPPRAFRDVIRAKR